ncbi:MAG: ZIP family metal transporter [Candidatus Methanomethylophilaceae archaeon]|nr:ZIP family metal transporter [Candidatus Methanomethylophilaceae archaeon]
MELLHAAVIDALLLFAVAAASAYLPFRIKKNKSLQAPVRTLSAGIMIGVLFLMMFPEAVEHGSNSGYSASACFYMIMAGFLLVLLMGYVIYSLTRGINPKYVGARSLWIGFCVDAFIDGIVIAAGLLAGESTGVVVMFAMCMNKATEVFALSTEIVARTEHGSAKKMMIVYTLLNPMAVMVGFFGLSGGPGDITAPALCFASGIFMYASLSEMVPETFEGEKRYSLKAIFVFSIGILIALAAEIATNAVLNRPLSGWNIDGQTVGAVLVQSYLFNLGIGRSVGLLA